MKNIAELIADGMTAYYDWWTAKYSEEVYGFVFFSTSLLEYGGCTVFTEEGLDRVVEKYRKDDYYANESDEQLRYTLRWSPCDSVHQMENEDIFDELNERLDVESQQIYEMSEEDSERRMSELYETVIEGINCFRARRIPRENENILVTMLWGDQSPEEIAYFIQKCNSENAAKKFNAELEA